MEGHPERVSPYQGSARTGRDAAVKERPEAHRIWWLKVHAGEYQIELVQMRLPHTLTPSRAAFASMSFSASRMDALFH